MATIEIDCTKITGWESFHTVFKGALGFPDFYGMNMDAWIDCMSYLFEGDAMNEFAIPTGDRLTIKLLATEDFTSRLPEIAIAFLECTAFVNQRYIEDIGSPVISITFV